MAMHLAKAMSAWAVLAMIGGCSSPASDSSNGGFSPAADPNGDPTADASPTDDASTSETAPTSGPVKAATPYQVKSVISAKCLDVTDKSTADGAAIQQWACTSGAKNQEFQFRSVGDGLYEITAVSSGKCVGVTGADDGAAVQQSACNGTDAQRFKLVDMGSSQFELVSATKCLDVTDSSLVDGAKLQSWACHGKDNQRFTFTEVGAPTPPDGGTTDSGTSETGGGDTGTTDTGPVTPPSTGNFPSRVTAPYVAVWNDNNLPNLSKATGNKFWTLAFVINGSGKCQPMWNGDTALDGNNYGKYISDLQKEGGDVIVSFGGASGTEIARSCDTVESLQAAYQKVVTQFHLSWIDLDIESGQESDATSIDRRNKALHNLQVANPGLKVSYTLAVDRTGLPDAQRKLLANAKTNGLDVTVVNIMAMDYGPCYSDMGQAAVDAAKATQGQLNTLGMSSTKVGVTPMIGTNDTACEKFSTADGKVLVDFAQSNGFIKLLAYWVQDSDPSHTYIDVFKTFH